MHRLLYAALITGLSAAFVLAAPQDAREIKPTISVETNLVTLSVTVTDAHGELVGGLTREQFTVFDNNEPQSIQFFSNDEMAATVGIVIDCSGSMRKRRTDVTLAATAFATSAHPLDEMFSVNFNDRVWEGLPVGVNFADSVDQLHHALERAPAVGMTALYDGIDRALDHLELGTRDRKALILVSDGGDNASVRTLAEVSERARRTSAVIYAVSLADPDDHDARPDVLRKLTRDTGGLVFIPRAGDDVSRAFALIGQEIRSGYMIGFSPQTAANGGFRTIRVIADAGDRRPLTVRTRAGYYAGRTSRGTK
jgi:Ca-activated chloride channel homolog